MLSTVEVLKAARSLITEPEFWCQGEMEDFKGRHCAVGAVAVMVGLKVDPLRDALKTSEIPGTGFAEAFAALNEAAARLYGVPEVAYINDRRGHAAALGVFDEAIAELESLETLEPELVA